MDVFDEVERRELNTSTDQLFVSRKHSASFYYYYLAWHAQVDKAMIPLHVLPFLPVNSSFSATRNQVRTFCLFSIGLIIESFNVGSSKISTIWS
jgi:hypothetical protein